MRGETKFVERFRKANDFWATFFGANRHLTVDDLAYELGMSQTAYELEVFDLNRGDAKALMPVTALAFLYDETVGFEDNRPLAIKTIKAFLGSTCSSEVKFSARRAAILYGIDEEREIVDLLPYA